MPKTRLGYTVRGKEWHVSETENGAVQPAGTIFTLDLQVGEAVSGPKRSAGAAGEQDATPTFCLDEALGAADAEVGQAGLMKTGTGSTTACTFVLPKTQSVVVPVPIFMMFSSAQG